MGSVFVPGNLGEKKDLPVIVWIHGYVSIHWSTKKSLYLFERGGYLAGSASPANGNDLIRDAGGGVVAVGIQYRLGLFGFLAGEKVHKAGALNVGLCTYLGSRQESQDGNLTRFWYSGSTSGITMGAEIRQLLPNGRIL